LSILAHVAVECRDRPSYRDPLAENADALDRSELYGICAGWSELGPSPAIPIGTEIPTLLLAGQFDPNAGPALSRRVAELIGGRAHWVEFALTGHNVRHFSPCGAAIVAAFISRPEQAPDTSCAQQPTPIRFLPLPQ